MTSRRRNATHPQDMADRKVLAAERNMDVARTFYESALSDYDHALVLDPQVLQTVHGLFGGVSSMARQKPSPCCENRL